MKQLGEISRAYIIKLLQNVTTCKGENKYDHSCSSEKKTKQRK